ncbi:MULTISPECIES: sensor histidine kinase [Actinomadura]|uniref:Anti-sigma factor RsbA family regulatory protein n=1 Tax=Actinomadura yumaensis TaxID=111807 RepID=A0ABW2D1W7_9ACTN|nr:sensor histidine kinase [Actinomadura sp. J1-007]MWK36423.1 sensor histidine kinase [Actinomadura sp. J1-007]
MRLEHRAFLYGGPEEFLAAAVPFLRAGIEAGEAVVAVVREANRGALRDTLGDDARAVDLYTSEGFYVHPVRTLKDYQRIVAANAPRRVRALAEPVWTGWDDRQLLEWTRYESLINVVFEGSGARALCPYDRASLPEPVIEQARRTHPLLLSERTGGGAGPGEWNERYVDPVSFGTRCDRAQRFDRPGDAEYLPIEDDDLHGLRTFVAERAAAHGVGARAVRNLVTAANEVAANALRHGVPPMGLWIWRDGDEVLCEIADHGLWRPGPLTGFIPPESALDRGFGLWTVRLLVDLMELRSGWDGTFVRLRVRV